MKIAQFNDMSVAQLVERFLIDALQQYKAQREGKIKKYNRIYDEMAAIGLELKSRPGDQRTALIPFLTHPNVHVRYMAAEYTLAVAPAAARQALQELSVISIFPQTANALGTLWALERGDRKPT